MNKKLPLVFLLIFTLLQAQAIITDKPATSPYGFIANNGQITDQNYNLNPSVLYLYNSGTGLNVHLKRNGFSYESVKVLNNIHASFYQGKTNPVQPLFNDLTWQIHRVDISFAGSNKNVTITTSEAAADYINYYTTDKKSDNNIKAYHYQKIIYHNIYAFIDVEFLLDTKQKQARFKYNFIIHPGGNINDIQLRFDGANKTTVADNGHLLIETNIGEIDESLPYSYQYDPASSEGMVQTIKASFTTRSENTFGITAINYNSNKTLVIDPAPWATYFGGSGDDRGLSLALDAGGNIITSGSTKSLYSIATSGAHQLTFSGNFDAFVVKYNSSGVRLWSTYFGGIAVDNGNDVVVNSGNDIIVTGNTRSASGIATAGAFQTGFGGGDSSGDAFVVKFNASGIRLWGTYFGGANEDYGDGIAIDPAGNLFITGWANSTNLATSGTYQDTKSNTGNADAFLAKFNASGARLWATYNGSDSNDYAFKVVCDVNGNAIITGYTNSDHGMNTNSAYQTSYGGNGDAFISKFSASGNRLWSTYYGGTDIDYGLDIGIDGVGNTYITGSSKSGSGIATSGAFQYTKSNEYDAFLLKLNPGGTRIWATYIGSGDFDGGIGIATDLKGVCAITGYTKSASNFASDSAFMVNYADGGQDAFVAKFDSAGMQGWLTYYGSSGIDQGNAAAIDSAGNIFITGATTSESGIASTSAQQSVYGGGEYDAFIAAFTTNGGLLYIQNNFVSNTQLICQGSVPVQISGSVPTGGYSIRNYLWLRSVNGPNSGYSPAPLPNNFASYSPNLLFVNTWYKRIVVSGEFKDTSSSVEIIVNAISPIIGYSINIPLQCFNGNNFIFNDTTSIATGYYTRLWNFGDGANDTSRLATLVKSYPAVGSHTIKLLVTGSTGCKDSLSRIINIRPNPIAGFTINNSTQCLNGNTFQLNDTSIVSMGLNSRIWNFGDGNISSLTSNAKTYNQNGLYTIKLLLTSINGCVDSLSKTVTILPSPVVGFSNSELYQCLNSNKFVFTDTTALTAGSFSRSWSLGSGSLTNSSISKTFEAPGIYQVQLLHVSSNNCRDSIAKTIIVYPQPLAKFTVNNSIQCLIGNSFIFNDNSTIPAGIYSRTWFTSDQSVHAGPILNKSFINSGEYQVTLKIIDQNNCKDSIDLLVQVKPNPAKPIITATSNTILQSTTASSYQWFLNNIPVFNSNNKLLLINQNGKYSITIDSTNGCSNTSDVFTTTTVGIAGFLYKDGIGLYPNPAANEVSINIPNTSPSQVVSIEIIDREGSLIFHTMRPLLSNVPVKIDLSNLQDGLYVVMINKKAMKLVVHK